MRTNHRRMALHLEKMESRDLLSGLNPIPTLETHDLDVRVPATALDRPAIVDHVRADAEHGSRTAIEAAGATTIAHPLDAIPDPPFRLGAPFSVSGTNFPTNFTVKPTFKDGQQDLIDKQLRLSISGVDSNGAKWVDLYFRRLTGTLAGNPALRWQVGAINGIALRKSVMLSNIFFYFTMDGKPVPGTPKGAADIYVDANPIASLSRLVPQVYFFSNFRPGPASGVLNLGSGISSGTSTYTAFLQSLNVPTTANGLHLFFLATPTS